MRNLLLLIACAGLVTVAACSKKDSNKEKPADSAEKDTAAPAGAADSFDPGAADALWAMAPADAVGGAIIVPGAGTDIHKALMRFMDIASAQPMGAELVGKMRAEAAKEDVNVLDASALKAAGIDIAGGAGIFASGPKKGFMVLPIVDRAAFRKLTGGTTETKEGLEVDIHEDDLFCTEKNKTYVCAPSVDQLLAFEGPSSGALAQRIKAIPAERRGHIEAAIDVAKLEEMGELDDDFKMAVSEPGLGFGSVRLESGAATMRMSLEAKPVGPLVPVVAVPGTLAAKVAAHNPSAIFRVALPAELMTRDMPDENPPMPGNLNLKKDVFGNLTGEFVAFAPSGKKPWGRLMVGVKDSAPFKTLIDAGCSLAPMSGMPGIATVAGPTGCKVTVDLQKVPGADPVMVQSFPNPIEVSADIADDHVAITVGTPADPDTTVPMSATGKSMVEEAWTMAIWVQSFMVARDIAPAWGQLQSMAPPDAVEGLRFGAWMLAHLSELALAGAVRADGFDAVVRVSTYLADSPDVYARYAEAVKKSLTGKAIDADLEAIAESAPDSLAGRAIRSGGGGSMLAAGVTGMLAAVAIPAFVKYQQKSIMYQEKMPEPPAMPASPTEPAAP